MDDAATRALMVEFYRNLWEKKRPKLDALRQVQIALLRRYDRDTGQLRAEQHEGELKGATGNPISPPLAPYYWAAFVLSGDWR